MRRFPKKKISWVCLWLDCRAAGALMWTLLVMALLASSAAELRCRHERCRYSNGKFEVDGNRIQIVQIDYYGSGLWLWIKCYGASVLDSPALPRVEPAGRLWKVKLEYCPLPVVGSLMDTLTTLNFKFYEPNAPDEPSGELLIKNLLAAPPLAAQHFVGLELLRNLEITTENHALPKRGFLAPLRGLRKLDMTNVTLPDGALDALPPLLNHLKLYHTGVKRLPEAIYSSVKLRMLMILSENPLDAVAVPPGVLQLELQSPATTLRLDTAPTLEKILLGNWTEPQPVSLMRCGALHTLHLKAPMMTTLPNGWLANCSFLEELVIENARNLTALPPKLFTNASKFWHLALRQGVLEMLPESLLDDVYFIRRLELDGNRLQTLPNRTFERAHYFVWILNLSSNDLDGGVLDVLAPLKWLRELDLARNPRIGEVCKSDGYSAIRNSTDLKQLILSRTGVTRICKDWQVSMPHLENLDLNHTKVSELSYTDMQFTRALKADVWLMDAPVAVVRTTREDFNNAEHAPTSYTSVHLDAALECDCRMYWTRRGLGHSANVLDRVSKMRCAGGGLLSDVPPEDMVCTRPEECAAAALPDSCTCFVRPDDDSHHDRRLVRVRCENASLSRVPRPRTLNDSTERLYELLVAHNQIAILHANDLQDNIKGLDVRYNALTRVNDETATRLGHVGGLLRLADNPLECDCSAAPLLSALRSRARSDTDLTEARCRDGSALSAAAIVACPQAAPSDVSLAAYLAGALAALLLVVLAAGACLATRERRFFLLAVLNRWGCVWRSAETEDDGCRYDAFLTFSHRDEAVVRELIARLEPPYRLCVHYRDWIPGCFISEQVVESVRESRRTVALVSRHFLASSWARAEFREAHAAAMLDARPRLIVVLLEEPAKLPLDAQILRYLSSNTYVQWGDPWFWDKLMLALPAPHPARLHRPRVPRQLELYPTTEPPVELSLVGNKAVSIDDFKS